MNRTIQCSCKYFLQCVLCIVMAVCETCSAGAAAVMSTLDLSALY